MYLPTELDLDYLAEQETELQENAISDDELYSLSDLLDFD